MNLGLGLKYLSIFNGQGFYTEFFFVWVYYEHKFKRKTLKTKIKMEQIRKDVMQQEGRIWQESEEGFRKTKIDGEVWLLDNIYKSKSVRKRKNINKSSCWKKIPQHQK
jgi:hypothetical protein